MPAVGTRPHRALRSSRRLVALATLALGTALIAPVATGGGQAAAAPAADCAETFPIADLGAGDTLDGLTVTTGTTPESFTARVLGVLDDGVAPGIDMIMVKVDPTGLDIDPAEVKGIWEGMSGSPLYAADGRIVGAVAYGLSWEQSWVAGVTPFADMVEYAGHGTARRVAVGARAARQVAAAAGVTTAQASEGFRQLPMPLSVVGASGRLLSPPARVRTGSAWFMDGAITAGRAAAALDAATIVPGGNMAASMAYGDILMGGVGTATWVCDGEVVGFGHPAAFLGNTTLALHPADSLYIQGDAPGFKVANIGAPVGTVFGDHLTGITASVGAAPSTTTIGVSSTAGSRSRSGTTHATVRDPELLAMTTYLQASANDTRVRDRQGPGSSVTSWRLAGTNGRGKPFTLAWTDRYLSTYDIASESGFLLGDVVYQVASMPGVELSSVSATNQITDDTSRLRLARLEILSRGEWARMRMRRPAAVRAGRSFTVRAVLRGPAGRSYLPFTFRVPAKSAGKVAQLGLTGGMSTGVSLGDSPAKAGKALSTAVRSDTVRAQFGREVDWADDDYIDYDDYYFRTARGRDPQVRFTRTRVSAPQPAVISGAAIATVMIR